MAVQISGNDITVPRDGTFTRNVTIGGTLTYEDVTNVDSVGLITARNGIIINSGGVNVGGALTVTTSHSQVGIFTANSNGANIRLFDDDTESKIRTVDGRLQLHADDGDNIADSQIRFMIDNDTKGFISAGSSFSLGNDADTYISRADANTLAVTTGGSERARITSSGKVGIGTDEPIGLLHLTAQNSDCELILESDTDNDDEYDNPRIIFRQDGHASQSSIGIGGTDNDSNIHNALTLKNSCSSDGGIIFMTNNVNGSLTPYQNHLESVERARITPTGDLRIGQSSTSAPAQSGSTTGISLNADGRAEFDGGNQITMVINRTNSGDIVQFRRNTLVKGEININASRVAYETTSDYRLKENITTLSNGITRLKTLKPSRFNFIEDPNNTIDGFIAHELQTVVPEAVSGTKDQVDSDNNPVYQGADASLVVPLLTAALQEAVAKIEVLESEVAALKSN